MRLERNFFLWVKWGPVTGFLEILWVLHHWKCSRPDWMELCAILCSGGCPCSGQGCWNKVIFQPRPFYEMISISLPSSFVLSFHDMKASLLKTRFSQRIKILVWDHTFLSWRWWVAEAILKKLPYFWGRKSL